MGALQAAAREGVRRKDKLLHRRHKACLAVGAFKAARLVVDDADDRDLSADDEQGDAQEQDARPGLHLGKPRGEHECDARKQTDGAERNAHRQFLLCLLPRLQKSGDVLLRLLPEGRPIQPLAREQFVDGNLQRVAQRQHQPDFGHPLARLPFGDGFLGNAQPVCKRLLRHAPFLAQFPDKFPRCDLIHNSSLYAYCIRNLLKCTPTLRRVSKNAGIFGRVEEYKFVLSESKKH